MAGREERNEVAAKQASEEAKSQGVFGRVRKPVKMFRARLYPRVSTSDQRLLDVVRRPRSALVLVWRLDREGRSVTDLLATLELSWAQSHEKTQKRACPR